MNTEMPQKENPLYRTLLALALIVLAAALRIAPHPWNFTPVGAMALFSGALLKDRRLAFLFPLVALFVGDIFIGFHKLLPIVYASFLINVAIGLWLSDRRQKSPIAPAAERLRAGNRCSRSASCPCATYEIALCAGSGCPACDRKLPGPPTPVAVAPMRDPCHGSNGFDRRGCDDRLTPTRRSRDIAGHAALHKIPISSVPSLRLIRSHCSNITRLKRSL